MIENTNLGLQAPQGLQPTGAVTGQPTSSGGLTMSDWEDYLATLDPAEAEALRAAIASDPDALAKLHTDQMSYADKLRQTPSPEGKTTRNQIYTAANPLEHLSAGADKVMGAMQLGQAQEDYASAEEARARALRGYGDFMSGQR